MDLNHTNTFCLYYHCQEREKTARREYLWTTLCSNPTKAPRSSPKLKKNNQLIFKWGKKQLYWVHQRNGMEMERDLESFAI